jgi:tetratricopeptide (TPR) repeat protein
VTPVVAWLRRRTEAEWVALAAGAATFGYVGWDGALWDPRFQLLLHLMAVGAIAGLGVLAWRGGLLPRTRLDVPLLALVAAFALATTSALNVGMSLRAMAVIVAMALMLPVALVALRHRATWVGVVVAVPIVALSVPALVVLIARRVEWVLAGAPGLPPIRLPGEGTPFGSVAVPPFVIWPAWAIAGVIEDDRLRWWVRAALVAVGVPLTILSGSRSAWLAIGVTLLVAGVPWAWRRRHRLDPRRGWTPRRAAAAAGILVAGGALAVVLLPRATAVTSLLYRASLWRDTLRAWSTDPLFGIGPGFMPYARQAAAPDFSFPVRQPHSHNLPLGVLGDAGLVGLVVALVAVAALALVAGPWRSRTPTGRAASLTLLGLGVGGLFEDLTFLPNFDLLVILLIAIALADAGAVRWAPIPRPPLRRTALALGGVAVAAPLLLAMVVSDAAGIAYRAGVDTAASARWDDATRWFARAVELDPWHPANAKALAVAADGAGDTQLARRAAEEATQRNPGDAASWVNLALLCRQLGDEACQGRATEQAVATAGFLRPELVNAAFSFESLGLTDEADEAYRRSLLSQLLTAFATDWPREIAIGDATIEDQAGAQFELNRLVAWWAVGEPIRADLIGDPATRALAHAMRGEREAAEEWLGRAIDRNPDQIPTWDVALVLRRHWGEPVDAVLRIEEAVRGRPVADRDAVPADPHAAPGLTVDIGSFRAYPRDGLVDAAIRLRTRPPYPWILEVLLPSG